MFNLITLMVSKKSKTSSKESQNKKFSFNFSSIIFSSKKIRALALVTILGMSVIVTSSCKQDPPVTQDSEDKDSADTIQDSEEANPDNPTQEPTDEDPTEPPQDSEETNPDNPTQEPTDEDPTEPPQDSEEANPDNPTQEPTDEDPTVEDPTIETPTVDIANAPIVNAIRELGFGIDIVDVEPVEGLYTPETGDLIDLKFTDYDVDIWMHMQLDREKSTKDNLVYKCVKSWDILYDEDIDAQDLHDRYFSKMTFDKENHSVSFFYTDDDDNTEKRLMTIRIELDENNKASFIYNGIGNAYKDHAQEVDNGEVFKPPGITRYDEIEIILAK